MSQDLEKGDPNHLPDQVVPEEEKAQTESTSRPLQSSLRQPKNGNEPKKEVRFTPDVPLETPNRPPLHEVMRQKDNHNFFRRCCLLVVVIILIVIGVLILASTIHESKARDPHQILS